MTSLYVFDLDGTLADQTHRRPYLDRPKPDWDGYFDACPLDAPIAPVVATYRALWQSGAELWIFSGRSERVRPQTEEWLRRHVQRVPSHHLMMRAVGDYRPDDVVKAEMLDRMLPEDRARLVAVFDDRDRVVRMWRSRGVQCYQVAPGDF